MLKPSSGITAVKKNLVIQVGTLPGSAQRDGTAVTVDISLLEMGSPTRSVRPTVSADAVLRESIVSLNTME